jgi:hypothetical protein
VCSRQTVHEPSRRGPAASGALASRTTGPIFPLPQHGSETRGATRRLSTPWRSLPGSGSACWCIGCGSHSAPQRAGRYPSPRSSSHAPQRDHPLPASSLSGFVTPQGSVERYDPISKPTALSTVTGFRDPQPKVARLSARQHVYLASCHLDDGFRAGLCSCHNLPLHSLDSGGYRRCGTEAPACTAPLQESVPHRLPCMVSSTFSHAGACECFVQQRRP